MESTVTSISTFLFWNTELFLDHHNAPIVAIHIIVRVLQNLLEPLAKAICWRKWPLASEGRTVLQPNHLKVWFCDLIWFIQDKLNEPNEDLICDARLQQKIFGLSIVDIAVKCKCAALLQLETSMF